jgi:hypothetical protein
MKRPGNIRGARLRWEGPYIFRGYKDQETKRQAVLEDGKGKKMVPRVQSDQAVLSQVGFYP